MIALKIAQARARVRGKERMNLSSLEPCVRSSTVIGYGFMEEVKYRRETYSPTNISTSAQPLPSPARAPSIKAQSISPLIHLPDTTHHMAKADADVASQLEPNGEVKGEITND